MCPLFRRQPEETFPLPFSVAAVERDNSMFIRMPFHTCVEKKSHMTCSSQSEWKCLLFAMLKNSLKGFNHTYITWGFNICRLLLAVHNMLFIKYMIC